MRKLLLVLLSLCTLCQVYSQNYDLIVKSNGDSIACIIDSISDSNIYFEMKSNNSWIQTNISMKDVSLYMRNEINYKQFVYKPGTSIIKSRRQAAIISMRDIQKNSLYVGIMTVNYSRMIPINEIGFTLAAGLSFLDGVALQTEITSLHGVNKHFFEPGILWWHDSIDDFLLIRTGYRYQSPKGFLFRIAPLFTIIESDFMVLPSMSIGYSF